MTLGHEVPTRAITRRMLFRRLGISAAIIAMLPRADTSSLAEPLTFTLGPSNGIDDAVTIQTAIDNMSALATASGTRGAIIGRHGETYRVSFNTRVVTIPVIGAVRPALVMRSNVVLDSIKMQAQDWPGFQVGVVVGPTGANNWGVLNCQINGNAPAGLTREYLHSGILLGSCSDVVIVHNVLTHFRESGVEGISANGRTSRGIWVEDNTITRCQGGAIKFDNGVTDIRIRRNWCVDNLGIVSGTFNGAECILLNDRTGINQRIYINDNVLVNWGPCILFGSGSAIDITGNYMAPPRGGSCFAVAGGIVANARIERNVMRGSVSAAAIDLHTSHNVRVKNNVFYGQYRNPVFISETGLATDNDYRDNTFGFAAAGAGVVRMITYTGSNSLTQPQCRIRTPPRDAPSAGPTAASEIQRCSKSNG